MDACLVNVTLCPRSLGPHAPGGVWTWARYFSLDPAHYPPPSAPTAWGPKPLEGLDLGPLLHRASCGLLRRMRALGARLARAEAAAMRAEVQVAADDGDVMRVELFLDAWDAAVAGGGAAVAGGGAAVAGGDAAVAGGNAAVAGGDAAVAGGGGCGYLEGLGFVCHKPYLEGLGFVCHKP